MKSTYCIWTLATLFFLLGENSCFTIKRVYNKSPTAKLDVAMKKKLNEVFFDDLLFIAELSPILCENGGTEYSRFVELVLNGQEGVKLEDMKEEQEMYEFILVLTEAYFETLSKIPNELIDYKPTSIFYENVNKNITPVFNNNKKPQYIPDANFEAQMEANSIALGKLLEELIIYFDSCGIEEHTTYKLNLFSSIPDSIATQLTQTTFADKIGIFHSFAMINESYKKAYESGCLKQFFNDIKMLDEDQLSKALKKLEMITFLGLNQTDYGKN